MRIFFEEVAKELQAKYPETDASTLRARIESIARRYNTNHNRRSGSRGQSEGVTIDSRYDGRLRSVPRANLYITRRGTGERVVLNILKDLVRPGLQEPKQWPEDNVDYQRLIERLQKELFTYSQECDSMEVKLYRRPAETLGIWYPEDFRGLLSTGILQEPYWI